MKAKVTKETPIPFYRVFPLGVVVETFRFVDPAEMPNAYISLTPEVAELNRVIAAGYRWIRSDGEYAIFERPAKA